MKYENLYYESPNDNIGVLDFNNTGVSEESSVIYRDYESSIEHYLLPISKQLENPVIKFLTLKAQWEVETAVLSSITEIAIHPAYQQIIGMGNVAVPLILSEMKKKPGHWFWALKSITGEDPISPKQRGKIKEMTEVWLNWGKKQGYIR